MRVILREDMDNLGHAGEVVTVRDGYARNFLLPRGLVALATEKDVARLEHERRVISVRAAKLAHKAISPTGLFGWRAYGERAQ